MIIKLKDFTELEIKNYFQKRINAQLCTQEIDYFKFFDDAIKEYKNIKYDTETGVCTNGKEFVSAYKYKKDIEKNPSREYIFDNHIAHNIFCEAGRLYRINNK